jgi:hypothetical protein
VPEGSQDLWLLAPAKPAANGSRLKTAPKIEIRTTEVREAQTESKISFTK